MILKSLPEVKPIDMIGGFEALAQALTSHLHDSAAVIHYDLGAVWSPGHLTRVGPA